MKLSGCDALIVILLVYSSNHNLLGLFMRATSYYLNYKINDLLSAPQVIDKGYSSDKVGVSVLYKHPAPLPGTPLSADVSRNDKEYHDIYLSHCLTCPRVRFYHRLLICHEHQVFLKFSGTDFQEPKWVRWKLDVCVRKKTLKTACMSLLNLAYYKL